MAVTCNFAGLCCRDGHKPHISKRWLVYFHSRACSLQSSDTVSHHLHDNCLHFIHSTIYKSLWYRLADLALPTDPCRVGWIMYPQPILQVRKLRLSCSKWQKLQELKLEFCSLRNAFIALSNILCVWFCTPSLHISEWRGSRTVNNWSIGKHLWFWIEVS